MGGSSLRRRVRSGQTSPDAVRSRRPDSDRWSSFRARVRGSAGAAEALRGPSVRSQGRRPWRQPPISGATEGARDGIAAAELGEPPIERATTGAPPTGPAGLSSVEGATAACPIVGRATAPGPTRPTASDPAGGCGRSLMTVEPALPGPRLSDADLPAEAASGPAGPAPWTGSTGSGTGVVRSERWPTSGRTVTDGLEGARPDASGAGAAAAVTERVGTLEPGGAERATNGEADAAEGAVGLVPGPSGATVRSGAADVDPSSARATFTTGSDGSRPTVGATCRVIPRLRALQRPRRPLSTAGWPPLRHRRAPRPLGAVSAPLDRAQPGRRKRLAADPAGARRGSSKHSIRRSRPLRRQPLPSPLEPRSARRRGPPT